MGGEELSAEVGRLSEENDRLRERILGARRLRAKSLEACVEAERERAALLGTVESLETELARVEAHRQELIASINAICGSESWRIGHALTWPARATRRLRPDRSPAG